MTGDPDKQTTRKKALGAYSSVESIFITFSLTTAPCIYFGMMNASHKYWLLSGSDQNECSSSRSSIQNEAVSSAKTLLADNSQIWHFQVFCRFFYNQVGIDALFSIYQTPLI